MSIIDLTPSLTPGARLSRAADVSHYIAANAGGFVRDFDAYAASRLYREVARVWRLATELLAVEASTDVASFDLAAWAVEHDLTVVCGFYGIRLGDGVA